MNDAPKIKKSALHFPVDRNYDRITLYTRLPQNYVLLLNYFHSILQSSSYKHNDYNNDEVCLLLHLFDLMSWVRLPLVFCPFIQNLKINIYIYIFYRAP